LIARRPVGDSPVLARRQDCTCAARWDENPLFGGGLFGHLRRHQQRGRPRRRNHPPRRKLIRRNLNRSRRSSTKVSPHLMRRTVLNSWRTSRATLFRRRKPALFSSLFEGVYKQDYGKYVSKKLLPKETAIEPARALIVFEALFEKRKVKVSANFVMEQDAPKIVQLRMEPL
jgi:hypothetical protein